MRTKSKTKDNLMALAHRFFIDGGPFTNDLGISVESIDADSISLSFDMEGRFIGLYRAPMLHGGVVAAVLDTAGGVAVFVDAARKKEELLPGDEVEWLKHLNTIDIHIEYLRPGTGKQFIAKAYIIRGGRHVAVTRMELYNEKKKMLAVGTGTYLVSVK